MIAVLSTTGIWTEFPNAETVTDYPDKGKIALFGRHGWVATLEASNVICVSRENPEAARLDMRKRGLSVADLISGKNESSS